MMQILSRSMHAFEICALLLLYSSWSDTVRTTLSVSPTQPSSPEDQCGTELPADSVYEILHMSIIHFYANHRIFEICALLLLYSLWSDVHCLLHERPLNAAKLIGERVTLTCASNDTVRPCGNLAWVYHRAKTLEQTDISMQGQLSALVSDYISLIDSSQGNCNLKIKAKASAEGNYECISVSTNEAASAELIILEHSPECDVKTAENHFNVTCWVRFLGNWVPEMEWIQVNRRSSASINSSESSISDELVRSTIILPRFNTTEKGHKCIMKFRETGRQHMKTIATNVPDYEWMSPIFGGGEEIKQTISEKEENKSIIFGLVVFIVFLVLVIVSLIVILLVMIVRSRRPEERPGDAGVDRTMGGLLKTDRGSVDR